MTYLEDTGVSVVFTVFNSSSYVIPNLVAILQRLRDQDELIIVDDCSTDDTVARITALLAERNDRRVQLHALKANSGGPATPRNTGADASKNAVLMFVDADDTLVGSVEGALAELRVSGLDALTFQHTRSSAPSRQDVTRVPPPVEVRLQCQYRKNRCNLSGAIVTKEAFKAAGGFEPSRNLSAVEDYIFWTEILAAGLRVGVSNRVMCRYGAAAGSISRNKLRMLKKTLLAQNVLYEKHKTKLSKEPRVVSIYWYCVASLQLLIARRMIAN